MEATFILNLMTITISFCVFSYALTQHILTLRHRRRKNRTIFEHRHLDSIPLYMEHEEQIHVDTSMDEWDAEFCKQMPKTEEGKDFFNRWYKQTRDEIDKTLKLIEKQIGVHEIKLGTIYPGKIVYEKDLPWGGMNEKGIDSY